MDWETLGRIAGNIFLGFIEYIFKISATIAVGIVAMTSGTLGEKIGYGFGSLTQVFRKIFETPDKVAELSVMVEDYNRMTAAGFNQKYGADAVNSLMAYLNGIIDYFQAVYYNLANEPVTTFLAAIAVFSVFYILGRILQFARQRGQGSWLVRMERRLGEKVFKTVPIKPTPAASGSSNYQSSSEDDFSSGFVPSSKRSQTQRTKDISSPFNKYVKKSDKKDKNKNKTEKSESASTKSKDDPSAEDTVKEEKENKPEESKPSNGSKFSAYRLEQQTSILDKVTEKNLKLKKTDSDQQVTEEEESDSEELFSIKFDKDQEPESDENTASEADTEELEDETVEMEDDEVTDVVDEEIETEDTAEETPSSGSSKKEKDLQKLLDDVENLKKEWKSEVGDDLETDEIEAESEEEEAVAEAVPEEEEEDDDIESELESALEEENTGDLEELDLEDHDQADDNLPDQPKIVYQAKEVFSEQETDGGETDESAATPKTKNSAAAEKPENDSSQSSPQKTETQTGQIEISVAEKPEKADPKTDQQKTKKKKKKSKKSKKVATGKNQSSGAKRKKKSDPDPISLMFAIESARAKD